MSMKHEAQKREERRITAAADRVTGQFHCSSSNHFATGKPVIIRGRKACQACADQRAKAIKGKDHG